MEEMHANIPSSKIDSEWPIVVQNRRGKSV